MESPDIVTTVPPDDGPVKGEAEETEGDRKYENDDDKLEPEDQTPETDVAKDVPEKRPVNAGDSHNT